MKKIWYYLFGDKQYTDLFKYDSLIALYLLDYVVKDDISFVAQAFDANIPLYEDLYGTEKRPKELEEEQIDKIIEEILNTLSLYFTLKVMCDKINC